MTCLFDEPKFCLNRFMNRLLTLFTLLLAPTLPGFGQTGSYHLNFSLSERNFADSIAIEMRDGRVIVPLAIGGRMRRFMLDTGAAQAIVYTDSDIEGCKSAGSIKAYDALGQQNIVPLVVLPPVTLGRLTLTGLQATVYERPKGQTDFDGIVGFDLVCKGVGMKIDVKNHLLVITNQKKYFAEESGFESRYKLRAWMHTPYLTLEPVKGYSEEVLFDTGSSLLYAMGYQSAGQVLPRLLEANPAQLEGRTTGSYAVGLHGREQEAEVVFLGLDSIVWGGFALRDVHTKTTQGNSYLGAGVLRYGAVTFLPWRKVVRFQPYMGGSGASVANRQVEKVVSDVDGLPTVTFVWRRGKAFEAGLREGDILLRVDGKELKNFDEYAHFRYLIGRVYTFVVRDPRGINKEVKMEW